jgi:hypothetical protein
MRVICLYHQKSDHGSVVDTYTEDIKRQHNVEIECLDLDSVEAARLAELYDVTIYPAFLVLDENGMLVWSWLEESMPLQQDIAYYVNSNK